MAEEQKTSKVDVESPAVLAPAKEPTPAPVEVADEKIHNPPPVESKALAVVESKLSIYIRVCFIYVNLLLRRIHSCLRWIIIVCNSEFLRLELRFQFTINKWIFLRCLRFLWVLLHMTWSILYLFRWNPSLLEFTTSSWHFQENYVFRGWYY